ncbi:S8 family serine peptidase [candidate division GN15 bacterium]|nr:S8 family serine peptidase [candidate division GN15 bacterium]
MLTRLRALAAACATVLLAASPVFADLDYTIKLRTGEFTPAPVRSAVAAGLVAQDEHVFVQFEEPINENTREALANQGIRLLDYVPNLAFTARLDQIPDQALLDQYGIRWIGPIQPEHKISPIIAEYGIFDWARRGGDKVQFVVVLHRDEDGQRWMQRFADDFGAEIIGFEPTMNYIDLILPEPAYFRLAELDAVAWIEQAYPYPEEHNDGARTNTGAEVLQGSPWNLTGAGVVVSEWDGGSVDDLHPDLLGRVQKMDFSSNSTHATHVAGTVMGNGASSGGTYAGMAPGASLKAYLWWGSGSEAQNEYSTVINNYNARVGTNSWGYGVGDPATQSACESVMGAYYTVCGTIDNIVRGSEGAPIAITWSAGNQRGSASKYCGSIGWTYNTVTPLPTAKNVIAVGAINSNNSSMTSFSSWGPTDDGRLKPDVVGPGCESGGGITSTSPGGGYTTMCGTSMSCPATAGTIALVLERWDQEIGTGTLLSSTVKGILINTAQDLGAVGPDYQFGHGKVDGVAAVEKIGFGENSYVQSEISTGTNHLYDLTVPGDASKLKVTLVWDDPGGTVSSSQNLINDLDLVLIDPFDGEEYPWVKDPDNPSMAATKAVDRKNNVETVEIDNPTPGLWKARVSGFNVPDGPQSYSIVFSPDGINTPGNLAALAVFDEGGLEELPGQSVPVDFYVTNIGADLDSVTVDVSDINGWLGGSITDSVVVLAPWDSALFSLTATVPSAALAGEYDLVTCEATSLSDPQVFAEQQTQVTAGAVYQVELTTPPLDTIGSPDTLLFSFDLTNSGNDTDFVTITPTNDSDWVLLPEIYQTLLDPGEVANVSFSVVTPAEVPDAAQTTVTIDASSDGGALAQTQFDLFTSNPFFPPALVAPADPTYLQNGVVTFEWDAIADSYTLYIASDSLMTSLVRTYPGIANTSFTIPSPDSLPDGGYYWGVRLHVGSDSSSLQRYPRLVVVDNVAPADLIPQNPGDSSYIKQQDFTFSYSVAPDKDPEDTSPEINWIQIAADPSFTTSLNTYGPVSGLNFPMPDLLDDGRWYWRAFAEDSAGNVSDTSLSNTFLLDTQAPLVAEPSLPIDGASVNADTILFRWSSQPDPGYETAPEYFYVHISKLENFGDFNTFASFVHADSLLLPASTLELNQQYWWRVKAFDSAGWFADYSSVNTFTYQQYICGDVNASGEAPDLSDVIYLVNGLFLGGPQPPNPSAADVNCSSTVDLPDVISLVNFLFLGGDPLCCL